VTGTVAPQGGPFPLRTLNRLLEALPEDDHRCGALFAQAVNAFGTHTTAAFAETVAGNWRKLPAAAVESAVKAVVDWVLDRPDPKESFHATYSTEKGTASFAGRRDYDLFNLIHILRRFDPKRTDELLLRRPALRVMVERFPEGRASMGNKHVQQQQFRQRGECRRDAV
jgi:hypothetical protein